jgi:hypothetical protein
VRIFCHPRVVDNLRALGNFQELLATAIDKTE